MSQFRHYLTIVFGFGVLVGTFALVSQPAYGQQTPTEFVLSCTIPAAQLICTSQVPVPSGKQLVIEFISAKVSISSSQSPQLRVFTPTFNMPVPGGTINLAHYIALNLAPRIANSSDHYYASQPVRLYVMPGGAVSIEARRYDTATGTSPFEVTFSGYLAAP